MSDGVQLVAMTSPSRGLSFKRSTVSPHSSWSATCRDDKDLSGSHKPGEISCETRRGNHLVSDQVTGDDKKRHNRLAGSFDVEDESRRRHTMMSRSVIAPGPLVELSASYTMSRIV